MQIFKAPLTWRRKEIGALQRHVTQCDTFSLVECDTEGLLKPQWQTRQWQGMWTPWQKQRFCPSVSCCLWKKIGKLWIFTLNREIGMREAKFSSVVISLFVTAQRRTFMPEGARHGHFSDYTAFLNTKWCMKMLYPDNRLYFNVKCVLGAHFYSVALFFFARNSFVKLLRLPVVLLYLLFWNNFCHTLSMTAVGWQRWDVGYLHF